jgi:hypothetical protein
VAKSREELFDLLAVAGGTGNLFVSKDYRFKLFITLGTMILEYGHYGISLLKSSFRVTI